MRGRATGSCSGRVGPAARISKRRRSRGRWCWRRCARTCSSQMADGRWQMVDGRWKRASLLHLPSTIYHLTSAMFWGCRSGVLHDHAFHDVGDVLAAVRGLLEKVEDLLPLDDRDRIALLLEQ